VVLLSMESVELVLVASVELVDVVVSAVLVDEVVVVVTIARKRPFSRLLQKGHTSKMHSPKWLQIASIGPLLLSGVHYELTFPWPGGLCLIIG
jgi:hypothetical protein